jgi:hypothetical protein
LVKEVAQKYVDQIAAIEGKSFSVKYIDREKTQILPLI